MQFVDTKRWVLYAPEHIKSLASKYAKSFKFRGVSTMLVRIFEQLPLQPVFPYIAGSLISFTADNPVTALIKLYEEFLSRLASHSNEVFIYFLAQCPLKRDLMRTVVLFDISSALYFFVRIPLTIVAGSMGLLGNYIISKKINVLSTELNVSAIIDIYDPRGKSWFLVNSPDVDEFFLLRIYLIKKIFNIHEVRFLVFNFSGENISMTEVNAPSDNEILNSLNLRIDKKDLVRNILENWVKKEVIPLFENECEKCLYKNICAKYAKK